MALAAAEHAREHKLIADEFLEELIVRRELAFNFARYAARPDRSTNCRTGRARRSRSTPATRGPRLHARAIRARRARTTRSGTPCQQEMLVRGNIHGYYRMYWGKKIIEWSATPEEALATMVHLHDRYALDGRDPNTYTNILWCFGLHDRPWPERAVFGMVRYMSLDGMHRKTDVPAYIREIEALA